ncbi:Do family serine endopeptidase [Nitrosophilus alvini]|uniref:Do family serine endopeptidase n=1 Tax=Nitrosophilus alvini TaxID=2714855 RepID=UPI00190C9936|nr:Do family serine endopeptidase [Nitrosophilus alvini]
MKKSLLLIFVACSIFLSAGVLDSLFGNKTTKFSEFTGETKRIMPGGQNVILSYYEALKDARESVVNISAIKVVKTAVPAAPFIEDPFLREFFGQFFGIVPQERIESSLGSGVIITKKGYILTNNHVIENAEKIAVSIPGKSRLYEAKIIGTDPKSDIAVIKIDAKNLKPIKFGDSSKLKVGDIVFAIGNPFGVGETVTQGIISALNKSGVGINEYENFIQTDAAINPGNSGGALIDTRGALIGINTAIISRTGGNIGIGFAIPSNMAKKVAKQLIETGYVERGYLGITIRDLTDDLYAFYNTKEGCVILGVEKNSPAWKAGLKRGDLIVEINGNKIRNSIDLKNTLGVLKPGSNITIKYIRDKSIHTASAELAPYPGEENIYLQNMELSGLKIEDLTDEIKRAYGIPQNIYGVLVTGVKRGSDAWRAGFMPGDIIIQVEDEIVKNRKDLLNAWRKYRNDKKRVYIHRNGYPMMLVIR